MFLFDGTSSAQMRQQNLPVFVFNELLNEPHLFQGPSNTKITIKPPIINIITSMMLHRAQFESHRFSHHK